MGRGAKGEVHMSDRTNRTYRRWLYASGWRVAFRDERGVFLKHDKLPGHTFTREWAAIVQAGWNAKRKAEVA